MLTTRSVVRVSTARAVRRLHGIVLNSEDQIKTSSLDDASASHVRPIAATMVWCAQDRRAPLIVLFYFILFIFYGQAKEKVRIVSVVQSEQSIALVGKNVRKAGYSDLKVDGRSDDARAAAQVGLNALAQVKSTLLSILDHHQ